MDSPLLKLSEASGIQIGPECEWPEDVDKEITEFLNSQEPKALFVVEQANGLVIGPPPQAPALTEPQPNELVYEQPLDKRVLAVTKRAGAIDQKDWIDKVSMVSMPLNDGTVFQNLHALVSQTCIPLFDSVNAPAATNARHRLVETERALASLLTSAEVPAVDLENTDIPAALENDDLNELQSIVNIWKQQIAMLVSSDRNPLLTTASDEISFWAALKDALNSVKKQLESENVQKVFEKLEKSKRFQTSYNFSLETGLDDAIASAELITQTLFKDLPLGELLAASDFEQLDLALQDIFDHLQKRLKASNYGPKRGVALAEVIGRDFARCFARLIDASIESLVDKYTLEAEPANANAETDLTVKAITELAAGIQKLVNCTEDVCESWDTGVREFLSLTRDLMRKNTDRYTVVRVQPSHTALVARLKGLNTLVSQHAELFPLVSTPELASGFNEILKSQPFLRLSDSEWRKIQAAYNKAAYAAETNVANELKMRLEAAEGNTNMLFTVFLEHKLVLTRARVRAVSYPFQAKLMTQTRHDLKQAAELMQELPSATKDIVRRVILVRQIKLRLSQLRERMGIIIGTDWKQHAEGAQIAGDLDAFDSQLNTDFDVKQWSNSYIPHRSDTRSSLGCGPGTNSVVLTTRSCDLVVNGTLPPRPQEAKSLQALGIWLPPSIYTSIDKVSCFFTKFKDLQTSLSILNSVCEAIRTNPRVSYATDVIKLGKNVLSFVFAGLTKVTWSSEDLDAFIEAFSRSCYTLEQRVLNLSSTDAAVDKVLASSASIETKKLEIQQLLANVVAPGYVDVVETNLNTTVQSELALVVARYTPEPVNLRVDMSANGITVSPKDDELLDQWISELNQLVQTNTFDLQQDLFKAYSQAFTRVWTEYTSVHSSSSLWTEINALFNTDYHEYIRELQPCANDTDLLELLIDKLVNVRKSYNQVLETKCEVNCKFEVFEKLDEWIKLLKNDISELLAGIVLPLIELLSQSKTQLEQHTFKNKNLVKSLAILNDTKLVLEKSRTVSKILVSASKAVEEEMHLQFNHEVDSLQSLYEERVSEKNKKRPDLAKALEHDCAKLFGDYRLFESSWNQEKPMSEKCVPKDALKLIQTAVEQLTVFTNQVKTLESAFDSLPSQFPSSLVTISTKLQSVLNETELLSKGYSILSKKHEELKRVLQLPFFETQFKDIHFAITQTELESVPDLAKQLAAYKFYNSELQAVLNLLPIIEVLKSTSAWDLPHMEMLLNKPINLNGQKFMIKHLRLAPLTLNEVKKAVQASEGEFQLRDYLNNIHTKWQQSKLEVKACVIQNLDSYLQLTTDNLAALHAMRSSSFFPLVSSLVRQTESQLQSAHQTFDQLIDAQQVYMQLRYLLLSPQVSKVLPTESKQFLMIESQFQDLFKKAQDELPLNFVAIPRLQDTLSVLHTELERLHKSLAGFLEVQRQKCPRLYFVGDDDVLEIIAYPLDVWGPKFLSHLFPSLSHLSTENNCTAVSKEGEMLNIGELSTRDAIQFINELDSKLKNAMKREIKKACLYFREFSFDTFTEFVRNTPIQACLVGLRTFYKADPSSEIFSKLLDMVPHFDFNDTVLGLRIKEALAVELNQIVSKAEIGIEFEFADNELEVRIGPHAFEYGYEYLGCPESAVRTKVTQNLFLSASIALAQSSGLSIAGPAGTGKTESVKALGNLLGRRVVVFNCDDEFDSMFVKRAVHGSAKTCSWVCFDEFNRLPRKVLSGMSPILASKVHEVPVFVTMNPGYSGRSVLPPNMRAQFREFWLNKPDTMEIARVLLTSQGKNKSDADRVVQLLSNLGSKLEPQRHYDWGLRALKTILKAMQKLSVNADKACEIVVRPRLVPSDRVLFNTFTNATSTSTPVDEMTSLLQLTSGLIVLGEPRSGKSTLIRQVATNLNAEIIVCDPSAMKKQALIGYVESGSREWEDGLVTRLIRRVIANRRQEQEKLFFIVFDGEVESQFAEALNSVLDETKQLTLPTGELISVPQNVKFIFETSDLRGATLATISRCSILCTEREQPFETNKLELELTETAHQIKHVFPSTARETCKSVLLQSKPLSLVWKYAGDSDEEGRKRITSIIRNHYPDIDASIGPDESLTSYRMVENKYVKWHSSNVDLPPNALVNAEIVVPTLETRANEFVLAEALKQDVPLLLVGPPGSGKTMTLLNALRNTPELELVALSLGVKSQPELVVQALEMHCQYTTTNGRKLLSPVGNKKLALFLDELNLPEPNEYGSSPILQLLRSMIEQNGFYNLKGEFVYIERVQFIGACNPPPERMPLPPRFIPLWFVVSVDYPAKESLNSIYSAYLSSFNAEKCCEPMIEVYTKLRTSMPNEIWTPRELTRWTRGLFSALNSTEATIDDDLLAKLFVYEGERVLADKLDVDKYLETKQILLTEAKNISPQNVPQTEIWSSLLTRQAQFVSLNVLSTFLQSRLEVFADEAAFDSDKQLIAHPDFITHVSRIIRVLKQPQGHILLKGVPSCGKRAAIRFSCWLCGYSYSCINGDSLYTEQDFASDLRTNILKSLRNPTVIILNDTLLERNAFVERMNALLANGETPALFTTAEHQKELELAARRSGLVGTEDVSKWVRQQVVNNLHAVFVTETANVREKLSPALLNRCTINNVEPWSVQTKQAIAQHWCMPTDLSNEVVGKLVQLPTLSGSRFIELCHQLYFQYKSNKSELEQQQKRLVSGIDCLKLTVLETQQLEKKLSKQQKELKTETKRSSEVLSLMLERQVEVERKRANAFELQSAVQKQKDEISLRQQEADRNLSTAKPFIKQAKEGVQNIRKAQLTELRAMNNPPEVVKMTLEAVCLVLKLRTDGSWRQVLAQVRGDEFIPRIVSFDSSKLDLPTVNAIKSEYMSRPDFTYERVDRASKAAGPLLRWVVAQIYYADALAAVEPLQKEVRRLAIKSEKSNEQLKVVESVLLELETSIEKCKLDYTNAVAHCESLKTEMQTNSKHFKRSQQLLHSLSGEQLRWQETASEFGDKLAAVPKESFVSAAQLALSGSLDPQQRKQLVSQASNLTDLQSAIQPLSNDEIVANSFSPVLIVDPSGTQLEKTIKTYENVSLSSFMLDQDQMLKQVDAALRFGQHLVIQHCERFDTVVMPLVLSEFVRKGQRLVVQLKNNEIDVSPDFKLTLYTRDYHGIQLKFPSLLVLLTVVDYTITPGAFESLVSDALIKTQMPDLADRRLKLQKVDLETKNRIISLESELLERLSKHTYQTTSTSLLNDEKLVKQLETVKSESESLSLARKSTQTTLKELEEAYDKFKLDATSASQVYENISKLTSINSFYNISADWVWQIAKNCALTPDFINSFKSQTSSRVAAVMKLKDRELINETAVPYPLVQLIEESSPTVPVLAGIATSNTDDPGPLIASNVQCAVLAAGETDSLDKQFINSLSNAIELGSWVVVQNVEISTDEWMRSLTKMLNSCRPNSKFRLVLTGLLDNVKEVPDLVATARPVCVERERGVKTGITVALKSIQSPSWIEFAVAYTHACLAELFPNALFGRTDLRCAELLAKNWPASKLPELLSRAVYGPRSDSERVFALACHAIDILKDMAVDECEDFVDQLPSDPDWMPSVI